MLSPRDRQTAHDSIMVGLGHDGSRSLWFSKRRKYTVHVFGSWSSDPHTGTHAVPCTLGALICCTGTFFSWLQHHSAITSHTTSVCSAVRVRSARRCEHCCLIQLGTRMQASTVTSIDEIFQRSNPVFSHDAHLIASQCPLFDLIEFCPMYRVQTNELHISAPSPSSIAKQTTPTRCF